MSERVNEVNNRLRPAMRALRDTEDWARLELGDELLASRIREIHESLTADVLHGVAYAYSARQKAALWDRYAFWRGHDPNEGATRRAIAVRQRRFLPFPFASSPKRGKRPEARAVGLDVKGASP